MEAGTHCSFTQNDKVMEISERSPFSLKSDNLTNELGLNCL